LKKDIGMLSFFFQCAAASGGLPQAGATAEALAQAGNATQKKVLWDCTNALKPDMNGLEIGTPTLGAEPVDAGPLVSAGARCNAGDGL
jgi:hypothetical protein